MRFEYRGLAVVRRHVPRPPPSAKRNEDPSTEEPIPPDPHPRCGRGRRIAPPSAARRWSASFRLALNTTRPRGDWKVPSRLGEKQSTVCQVRAKPGTTAEHNQTDERRPDNHFGARKPIWPSGGKSLT